MKQPMNIDCEFVPQAPWEATIAYAEAHVGDVGVEPNDGYRALEESLFEQAARDVREHAARLANLEFARARHDWNEQP